MLACLVYCSPVAVCSELPVCQRQALEVSGQALRAGATDSSLSRSWIVWFSEE